MHKVREEQREMINYAMQLKTELCVQTAEQMEATQEYLRESIRLEATKMQIFDMTHPEWY